jgi:hypothetical protein
MKPLKLFLCNLTFAVSGCGGGDGGSRNIEFRPSTVTFTGIENQPIPSQTVSVNVGLGDSRRYVGVENKSPGLASVYTDITHIDAFKVTVAPVSGLRKGTYNGAFDALVCRDTDCRDVLDRGAFQYTITIN